MKEENCLLYSIAANIAIFAHNFEKVIVMMIQMIYFDNTIQFLKADKDTYPRGEWGPRLSNFQMIFYGLQDFSKNALHFFIKGVSRICESLKGVIQNNFLGCVPDPHATRILDSPWTDNFLALR